MKKSKEEIKTTIDETIEDADKKISLLEDIEDSMNVEQKDVVEKSFYDDLESKYNELNSKYIDLQEKYKSRFFSGSSNENIQKPTFDEGLKEVTYIDVTEI